MIAGHLQIKNDYYYMVLSYLDANGKRKQPWFPTGLPIKNSKKRAEKMLLELRQTYVPPAEHKSNGELSADMLFADFMDPLSPQRAAPAPPNGSNPRYTSASSDAPPCRRGCTE